MNIVFAYHNGDAELALLSAKAITAFGINMRHKATVCATNDSALLFDIIEELKKSFPEVGRIIAQDGYNGWPLGPNQMFSDAASQCYAVNEPWMFWEPDCVPMKQGWADDLEAEFRKEPAILGHQYEGGMATNGKNIYKMIVGSAIYPPNFLDFCPSARSLDNYNLAYRSAGTIPEPWDVRCRWNFMAIGRDCPLLRTYWKSVNYQWKDGKIVFFAEDPEAQAVQGVTCPDRVISSKAVVIHGCKDGSLHKMAIAGFPIPSDSTGLDIPSNSMGLEQGVGQNAPTLNIPDQEQTFSNVSVGDEIEIIHIPVREYVQNINNDAQKVTVCDKTSLVMPNSPDVANCRKVTVKRKNKSPSKAKKRRNLSPEERQRRSEAMKAILARKAERKAQGVV
jgi:D-ribose pyranose/furanose isomerase RbsD